MDPRPAASCLALARSQGEGTRARPLLGPQKWGCPSSSLSVGFSRSSVGTGAHGTERSYGRIERRRFGVMQVFTQTPTVSRVAFRARRGRLTRPGDSDLCSGRVASTAAADARGK